MSPISVKPSAIALVIGGVLFAAGNLLHPLQHNDAAYQAARWEAAHVVILASIPFLLLAWPLLHNTLRRLGAARTSTAAAVLTVVGSVGIASGTLAEAFIAPKAGYETMKSYENGGFGTVSAILGMCWVASLPVLAYALGRARLVGPLLRWGIVAAFVALLGATSSTSKAAGAVIIATTAFYGLVVAWVGVGLARLATVGTTRRPVEAAR